MKKIISGLFGIIMTTTVVSGVAYSVFTSTAVAEGINVTAGSAGLKILNIVSGSFVDYWNTGLNLDNVYPGFEQTTQVTLKNDSTAAVSLEVTGQITAADNWPNLTEAVEIKITDHSDSSKSTNWMTLSEWKDAPVTFPGEAIKQNEEKMYDVSIRVPHQYSENTTLAGTEIGNEISGLTLENIQFTLIGTQTK